MSRRNGAPQPDDAPDEMGPPLTERALLVRALGECALAMQSAGAAMAAAATLLQRAGAAPPAPRPRPEPDAVFTMGGK